MKRTIVVVCAGLMSGCVSLSSMESREYRYLAARGVDVDHPAGEFDPPNSLLAAGALNILPGFGNFYLAVGRGGDASQAVFGFLNLLAWPIGIVWSVPEAAIDAHTLNKREMLYYYHYEPDGKKALEKLGLKFE